MTIQSSLYQNLNLYIASGCKPNLNGHSQATWPAPHPMQGRNRQEVTLTPQKALYGATQICASNLTGANPSSPCSVLNPGSRGQDAACNDTTNPNPRLNPSPHCAFPHPEMLLPPSKIALLPFSPTPYASILTLTYTYYTGTTSAQFILWIGLPIFQPCLLVSCSLFMKPLPNHIPTVESIAKCTRCTVQSLL